MFTSLQKRESDEADMAVDIAPLIDMVFILLIFFLVNAAFVQDQGVTVQRPEATHSRALEPHHLRITVAASGAVFMQGKPVELAQVAEGVRTALGRQEDTAVIVVPDRDLPAGRLVEVIDAAKSGGARDISIATREPG